MIKSNVPGGKEFAVAYYRWALQEWEREVGLDFPTLRAVDNSTSRALLLVMNSLAAEDRLPTGRLLAKRSHRDAARLVDQPLTQAEEARLRILGSQRDGLEPWPSLRSTVNIDRSALKRQVKERIEPILGKDREAVSSGVWQYHTSIGSWVVDTRIEFPRNGALIRYQHDIAAAPEDITYFASCLSAMAWLGVTAVSEWSDITGPGVSAIVDGLATVCRRFIEAIPDLLPENRIIMGGEPWWYVVPYEPGVTKALADLQQREFEAGRYAPLIWFPFLDGHLTTASTVHGYVSMDAALRAAGAVGTRSILDIRRVASDPDDIGGGVVAPVSEEFLQERYGTLHPTRNMVEVADVLDERVCRGQAIYLILFQGDAPSEILFAGYSCG